MASSNWGKFAVLGAFSLVTGYTVGIVIDRIYHHLTKRDPAEEEKNTVYIPEQDTWEEQTKPKLETILEADEEIENPISIKDKIDPELHETLLKSPEDYHFKMKITVDQKDVDMLNETITELGMKHRSTYKSYLPGSYPSVVTAEGTGKQFLKLLEYACVQQIDQLAVTYTCN